jgi:meso-butanediol dehydrogenase / (S,S)-butanediol dehydrogenase / diacetyl reductase
MSKLEGKIAIVTGGSRGIGLGIAKRLAQDGADIIIGDVLVDEMTKAKTEIEALGVKCITMPCDVTQEADCQALVDKAVAEYGKLDIMVANAGIANIKLMTETTAEDWDQIFAVNTKGVFLCDKAAALQMMKQNYGKIINCASIAAHAGFAFLGGYSATKFAVRGLTQALAKELGKYNIQVNAYCPGIVGTKMWELIDEKMGPYLGNAKGETLKQYTGLITAGRVETPDDVATFVSYLSSSDSDYMTGQSVMIDGGIIMN